MIELKRLYYAVVLKLWEMFREDIVALDGTETVSDYQWNKICDRYIKFSIEEYPKHLHGYINNMLMIHLAELENICGDRLHLNYK